MQEKLCVCQDFFGYNLNSFYKQQRKNQTPIWNLIVSPLESAISYKFLMFQKISYRECLFKEPFFSAFVIREHLTRED